MHIFNTSNKTLIYPNELEKTLPASLEQIKFIQKSRQIIGKILSKKDPRLLVIIGPCSIHDIASALEYARKLKEFSESLSDVFFVVMRVYFEKSRTSMGWKGFSYDPYLNGSNDLASGIVLTRQLLLQITEMELPIACELLDPHLLPYFKDLISWGCIGARTTESQVHRQMASSLDFPIGFKNTTSGNIEAAAHGVLASSQPHSFVSINAEGMLTVLETLGNPDSHVVLRGGMNRPNYDPQSLAFAVECLERLQLPSSLVVDCSHDNSFRCHQNQPTVFKSVLEQIVNGNPNVKGIILESHLNEGQQPFPESPLFLKYGVSITDSCISWDSSQSLLTWGYKILKNAFLLLFVLSLTSCYRPRPISAFSDYVSNASFASYHVGTPGPYLNAPLVGQRIYVRWDLPKSSDITDLKFILTVRFSDHKETTQEVILSKRTGIHTYDVLNEEYFDHGGISTFKVDLWSHGIKIDEWKHQMWVDLITFPED